MGLFNKGKKAAKAKAMEREAITSIVGNGNNSTQKPNGGKNDKFIIANQQECEKQMEGIIDNLKELRSVIMHNPDLEELGNDVIDVVTRLKQGRNKSNSNIQYAIDSFLMNKIEACFAYASSGNKVGTLMGLKQIKDLATERGNAAANLNKYVIKDYLLARKQYDTFLIEKQITEQKMADNTNQIERLKAMGNADPTNKALINQLINQVKDLKGDNELLDKEASRLQDKIDSTKLLINSKESKIQNGEIEGFDLYQELINEAALSEEDNVRDEMISEATQDLSKAGQRTNVRSKNITFDNQEIADEHEEDSVEDRLNALNSL